MEDRKLAQNYRPITQLYSYAEVTSFTDVTAVVQGDFNGDPVITIFSSGFPMICIEVELSPEDEPYTILEPVADAHRASLVELYFQIGELSEDHKERYADAIGTDQELSVFHDIMQYCEGHGVCGLVDEAVETFRLLQSAKKERW
jgi:hypothetical protein